MYRFNQEYRRPRTTHVTMIPMYTKHDCTVYKNIVFNTINHTKTYLLIVCIYIS